MKNQSEKQPSLIQQILILALPIVMENLLQALLGTVDTWFAGKLDDTAIAAIGATTLIVNLFLAFYTAISVGTSAVISRYVGEKNLDKANHATGQSVLVSLILGTLVGVIAFLFRDQILTISGAEGAVIEAAAPYYMIVAVPSVFACLVLVLSACLRASKDSVTPMIVSGAANILNIVLDALFLTMGMGIAGLALATTLSRVVSAAILFVKLHRKMPMLHIRSPEPSNTIPTFRHSVFPPRFPHWSESVLVRKISKKTGRLPGRPGFAPMRS